ncbi:MAG: histidine--tRNA ligase [Lachnospiraceae bacterium]|nr:histidine--tRNA ligase [Lachnospiraceae bacterium]MBQ9606200.1 histidine--tRNA ligase [Lachnospiraceae bacterium]
MGDKLIKKPTTGMKDILPAEMEIRDYVEKTVREVYGSFGFLHIETPEVEHIENLCSDQGGENEKLIFKIMKRGEKLDIAGAKTENDLADSGLRYDLTLPLSRYYANNNPSLMMPFKALQTGNVFRADRPQKGRFRQFKQCDIDIIGDPSDLAEIELVNATTTLLAKLGFKGFKVRINDRRLLKAMGAYAGFDEAALPEIFIILDKMDKIGIDGVEQELKGAGYDPAAVDKYIALFKEADDTAEGVKRIGEILGDTVQESVIGDLTEIFAAVSETSGANFRLSFDPTLVRGMGYYTGTIFEIEMEEFGSSVAGGGRYDGMIGRFTGQDVPACGFSIGFERIITILLDKGFKVPGSPAKTAFLIEKGVDAAKLADIMKEAHELRAKGETVLIARMAKNKKFQKDNLEKSGYTTFRDFYRN